MEGVQGIKWRIYKGKSGECARDKVEDIQGKKWRVCKG